MNRTSLIQKNKGTPLPVGPQSEFVAGTLKRIPYRSREIGVYRYGDDFFAMLDFCPHQWAKVCSGTFECAIGSDDQGKFTQHADTPIVRCPWHGWEFDLHDGHCLGDARYKLKTFPVSIEDGIVMVWV